jgi:hypothetical protein
MKERTPNEILRCLSSSDCKECIRRAEVEPEQCYHNKFAQEVSVSSIYNNDDQTNDVYVGNVLRLKIPVLTGSFFRKKIKSELLNKLPPQLTKKQYSELAPEEIPGYNFALNEVRRVIEEVFGEGE